MSWLIIIGIRILQQKNNYNQVNVWFLFVIFSSTQDKGKAERPDWGRINKNLVDEVFCPDLPLRVQNSAELISSV